MNWRRAITLALRLVLGGIFIYASLDKIVHPRAFAEIIYNYQILPGSLINLSAVILPWLELFLGLLLISGRFMVGGHLLEHVTTGCFLGRAPVQPGPGTGHPLRLFQHPGYRGNAHGLVRGA